MSILTAAADYAPPRADDADAIAAMVSAFAAQQQAFKANRNPTIAERRERIEALMAMMLSNRARIHDALVSDFGTHPAGASDLIEAVGPVGRAQYVLDNLEAWMAPMPREFDAGLLGSAEVFIQSQPKGVIGNMVPWNFPFDIAVGPLIEMLAAGNRVMIKPSEFTPASARLLADMVAQTFAPDLVYVAVGELDLAKAFNAMPFDHILYTGSPNVGRMVMAAAAANLTPVTLELGGKCPTIMLPGSVTDTNIEAVLGTKTIKNGQMCISVDHCFVPSAEVENFVARSQAYFAEKVPDYTAGPDITGIISDRHLGRLEGLLDEARDRQCRIVQLEPDAVIDRTARRMPVSLVVDPPADLGIMHEEIFGPILPIIPYDSVDAVIDRINDGERPLGVYIFGEDRAEMDRVIASTSSGGACINTCAVQGALPSLAFGGVGTSGMGRHHGVEGFREFSNQRGIVVRQQPDNVRLFYPPYANAVEHLKDLG